MNDRDAALYALAMMLVAGLMLALIATKYSENMARLARDCPAAVEVTP